MPNLFAEASAVIDRLVPASTSRRRELRLSRSRGAKLQNITDSTFLTREAGSNAARSWPTCTASSVREAEAVAERAWLAGRRTA